MMQRMLLHSTGEEQNLPAGSVIGHKDAVCGLFISGAEPAGVLAAAATLPAAGDLYALVYVHAEVIVSELTFGDGVDAAEQATALAALRGKGVYASEA